MLHIIYIYYIPGLEAELVEVVHAVAPIVPADYIYIYIYIYIYLYIYR